jgi:2-keto-3-deoxy-L-rhamnonate aldolase RhmA
VGSSDLALDITGSPLFDPALAQVGRAVEQIARNTRDRGKIAAIHIVNMAHAGLVRELGYQHVVFASDYRLMMKAAAEAYAELSIALA